MICSVLQCIVVCRSVLMMHFAGPTSHTPSPAHEPSITAATTNPAAAASVDSATEAVAQFSRQILTIKEVLCPGVLSPKGRIVLLGVPGGASGAGGAGGRRLWVASLTSLSRGNGYEMDGEFSKVNLLLNLLYEITLELTFANLRL